MTALRALPAAVAVLALAACVADTTPHDAGPQPDASIEDAAPPDVSTATPCGPTACDSVEQVCVVQLPFDADPIYSCGPVPSGCELDRSCECVGFTYCLDALDTCVTGPANTITCECPNCL